MEQPSSPDPKASGERPLHVKLSIADAFPLRIDHKQMPPEKTPLAPTLVQRLWTRLEEWWKKRQRRTQYLVAILLGFGVLVMFAAAGYLVYQWQLTLPGILTRKEIGSYRCTLTGPSVVIPYETATLQLTLTNTTPLTVTQPLTSVAVLVSQTGDLPLVPDRTGWLITFGDLPSGVSATREITVTLNTGLWLSPSRASLDFQVKGGADSWQPLTSVNLGAYPIPGVTQWKNVFVGGVVFLAGILGAVFRQQLLRLLGIVERN